MIRTTNTVTYRDVHGRITTAEVVRIHPQTFEVQVHSNKGDAFIPRNRLITPEHQTTYAYRKPSTNEWETITEPNGFADSTIHGLTHRGINVVVLAKG